MLIYKQTPPSIVLAPYVLRYFEISGPTSPESPMMVSSLPLGNTTIVFHFGDIMDVTNVSYDGRHLPRFYVLGPYTRPILIEHNKGMAGGFGITFKPGCFYHFSGNSQREFKDLTIDMEDVFGSSIRRLSDQLFEAKDFEKRVKIAESFLLLLLRKRDPKGHMIDDAVAKIISQKGLIRVENLSKQFNTNRFYLTRTFQRRIGLSVKQFSRIVRFNDILHTLHKTPSLSPMDLVAKYQFHDLPHLAKDFKEMSNRNISEFIHTDPEFSYFMSGS